MIDAAAAWDVPEHGLPLMPVFRECGFLWVEAPLPLDDVVGHAKFQGFGVPIGGGDLGATTRFDYEALFDQGKIDIAQPDVTMAGGLTELKRIAEIARAAWQARRAARLQEQHHASPATSPSSASFGGRRCSNTRPAARRSAGS